MLAKVYQLASLISNSPSFVFFSPLRFKRFNNKYLTPFLVREKNVIEPKLLETYSNIKKQEAMSHLHGNYGAAQNIESFANLLRTAATHPQ